MTIEFPTTTVPHCDEVDHGVELLLGPLSLPEGFAQPIHAYQVHPKGEYLAHDPATHPERGLVTRETPVGSIGSCFAGRIKEWLTRHRYRFLQTETGPGCENGSARFGQVYSTACLRQIFEHAFGQFRPLERYWRIRGGLADPYRTRIIWRNEEAAEEERRRHAAATRSLVKQCRVLVCTLGLAETWRHLQDFATFWRLPLEYNSERHGFHLLSVEENLANLEATYTLLRAHNPNLRMVITLSPVPLNQTFRDMSCIAADNISKAILRVAIDRLLQRNPEIIYFPAFEMVRSLEREPWEPDWRHVRSETVDRIMTAFMRSYGAE